MFAKNYQKNIYPKNNSYCVFILLFLVCFIFPFAATTAEPLVLDKNFQEQSILKNLDVYEDTTHKMTLQDILKPDIQKHFKANQQKSHEFGFTKSNYWFRFQIKNDLTNCQSPVLQIGKIQPHRISIYYCDNNQEWHAIDYHELKVASRLSTIYLTVPGNSKRMFYVKLKGRGGPLVYLPFQLYTFQEFQFFSLSVFLFIGLYFGIMFFVLIASIIMSIRLKDSTYLFYSIFVLCYSFFQSVDLGLINPYFPLGPWHEIGVLLSFYSIHLFSRKFLDIKKFPWLSRISLAFMAISLLLLLNLIVLGNLYMIRIMPVLFVATAIMFIWISWLKQKQGSPPARIYLISWFPLLMGGVVHIIWIESSASYSWVMMHIPQLGALFQVLLSWLALVEMARKKQQEAQDKILQMEKDESHRLEKLVDERTQELDQELNVTRRLYQAAWERVYGDLLGESQTIVDVRRQIEDYASRLTPVFLSGPSGAGHEAIARAIHMASPQRERPFILVNCITKPATSKIDPDAQHCCSQSTIKLAQGGTLFIDEFHQIDQESQIDLLTLLNSPEPNTRVIIFIPTDAITKEELQDKISASLLKRLSQNQLNIPSLHERNEDIPILINHFIEEYSRRQGKFVKTINEESITRALDYDWPRNIRQLRQVIEHAVTTSTDSEIEITEEALYGGEYLGHYQLLNKIGEGGMGEVWLAQHRLLARPVALKLIRTELETTIEERQLAYKRFEREARMTAKLKSPNSIRLFDYGVTDHGEFYFIMELLRGMTLYKMVEEYGPLPPARTVMLLQQVCRSLMEAHEIGIVHRDIKPHNLFVCKMGSEYDFLKVLDFGIVKPHENLEQLSEDEKSEIMGSIYTIAPEMISNPEDASPQSDIYAIGCTAYWMLTGNYLFYRDTISAMAWEHLHTPPTPPSAVTSSPILKELDQLILECLNKNPKMRPSSTEELWQRLETIAQNNLWTRQQAIEWWNNNASSVIEEEEKQIFETNNEVNNEANKVARTFIHSTKPRFNHSISSWEQIFDEDD